MNIISYVQHQYFSAEIKEIQLSVKAGKSLNIKKNNPLYRLDPVLVDEKLRVGGRLENALIDYNSKHPLILPKDSPVSRLIIEYAHQSVGHLGTNTVLARVREKYWILGATKIIKGIINKCVVCRKYKAKTCDQKMASLPAERVSSCNPPFSHVGMDYFGPIEVKRGRTTMKRYGVIFTCLSIRAVHLEVAHSLSSDSCINTIRRFVARRGPVQLIWSDNGTNLVGAQRELKEEIAKWNESHIVESLQQRDISWKFNPPTASHFGGVWERLIRSARKILYSLLKEQMSHLDDESLSTLFCEVE